jgi:hypothetical protein
MQFDWKDITVFIVLERHTGKSFQVPRQAKGATATIKGCIKGQQQHAGKKVHAATQPSR